MGVNKTNVAKETNGNLASLVAKDYATQTTLATRLSESDFDNKTGSLTETAPATDTASSGLNGRLQRIAQRITSLITALGTPFQAGGSIGNTSFGATQSGTWTVQPGNIANTTAWKVDGSAVTQPVSGTVTTTPPSNASSNISQINGVTPLMGNGVTGTGSQRVTIASDNSAIAISAASLPLPTGASTAAKQPALGTAGSPSADVISVQGVAGGRSIIVDGSAVTQPISVAAPTTIYHGKKTVTTAGTRVALASSQSVRSVCIKALQTNGGYIYVGDVTTSSTTGFQLLAGDTISLDIANLSTIYLDSSVSGEGVTYISSN
jgi:hypothetical protein